MHKFIFENDGDRNNRKRLREFGGFDYNDDNDKFVAKIQYAKTNLNSGDMVAICNILGLDYDTDDVVKYVLNNLLKDKLLQNKEVNETDEEDNDEDEDVINDDNEDSINDDNADSINDDNEDQDVESINESIISKQSQHKTTSGRNIQKRNAPYFALNFKDVEDSMQIIDGRSNISIQPWIKEFEETANLMQWDDLQKMIFAKRSLKGLAKMFISSERGLTTWRKLKTALTNEFSEQVNSAKLHEMLIKRKMKKDETASEYFYVMKEIASKGSLEDAALIQYIIDGIGDLNVNKAILYGGNNITEFKKKLCHYETLS